jgi:hypothetical protein
MNADTKRRWIAKARKIGLRVHAGMTTAQIITLVTGRPYKDRNAGKPHGYIPGGTV